MTDTAQLCLACHKPIPPSQGPIPRLYCNRACKQKAYRQKKAQEAREQQRAINQDTVSRIRELESHLAQLEDENRELRARLVTEHRYLMDSEPRPFRAWLRKRKFPEGSFANRLLADSRFEKPRYSKAWYEATLPSYGYSPEDIQAFRDLWKVMLFEQQS